MACVETRIGLLRHRVVPDLPSAALCGLDPAAAPKQVAVGRPGVSATHPPTRLVNPGALAAMHALGIDSYEDLLLLMAQARLPMPRLPDAQTDDMVLQLKALPTA